MTRGAVVRGSARCPPGFLAGLRELCDAHDILLIADEVGWGGSERLLLKADEAVAHALGGGCVTRRARNATHSG